MGYLVTRATPFPVSSASLIVSLAAQPVSTNIDGRETIEAFASTVGGDPANVLLRAVATTSTAKLFAGKQAGDIVIIAGDLTLIDEGNTPTVKVRVLCDATKDQYLNEVTIVGRLAGDARAAESAKSASRSLAVNRFNNGKEITDWYTVRGFGFSKEKLEKAVKGTLVSVTGALEQRTNRNGQTYCEIKARTIRLHGKPKSSAGQHDLSGGKAAGYSHEDFLDSDNDMPSNWN